LGIHKRRISHLREKLRSESIDAFLVSNPENRRYLSGFTAIDHQIGESSGFLLISQDQTLLATDFRYKLQAESETHGFAVFIYEQGLIDSLQEILERLKARRLGFESTNLTYDLFDRFRTSLKESTIEFIPTKGLVEDMRASKEPIEIEAIKRALELTERVFEEAASTLKPDMSEKELASYIDYLIRQRGAEDVAFPPIVAAGPNSSMPHAIPTDRKIHVREPIVIDLGAKLEGYCSDMTRTLFIEKPDEKIQEIYKIVRKAQLHAIHNMKAGMKAKTADALAREVITQAGYGDYFGHSLGHGVGLAVHEHPRVGKATETILRENMVVTVEPGIYLSGIGGVRLENMAVLKKDGAVVLNKNESFYDFE
jgi:Xaa-Pro aminopeptidase